MESGGKVVIGNNVVINATSKSRTILNAFGGENIIIGDDCLLSDSIQIHNTDYHSLISNGKRYNYPKSIIIGSHCWIGLNAIILKGVELSNDTVVGACSVVSKTVHV